MVPDYVSFPPFSVDLGDGISIAIGSNLMDEGMTSQSFRNPFDISRSGLLGQLARMKTNFFHATPTTPNLIEDGKDLRDNLSLSLSLSLSWS